MEWTSTWADEVVTNRPRSIVVEAADTTLVAFMDLPSRKVESSDNESIDHYKRAFWCGAAGVRMDLLGADRASQVFLGVLQGAFQDMRDLGYEFVRAAAPWEQHPYLPKPFAAYPGVRIEQFLDDKGVTKHLVEWRLEDAVAALAADPLAQAAGLSWTADGKSVPTDR